MVSYKIGLGQRYFILILFTYYSINNFEYIFYFYIFSFRFNFSLSFSCYFVILISFCLI